MKKILQHFKSMLSFEIEPQQEYIDRFVYIIRQDFNAQEQNEILLSIISKLTDLREQDLRQMEKDYAILQENTNYLKEKVYLT